MKRKNRNSTKTHSFILQLPLFPKGVFQEGSEGRLFLAEAFKSKTTAIENILEDVERREWKSGRGRKYGSGEIVPSYIVGGVDTLVEKGEAKNVHAAFPEIAEVTGYEKGTGGGSDYVKKIYYTALGRDRYRNLIIWNDTDFLEENSKELRNVEDGLEELIALGGWCSRDYLARGLGDEKADQLFSCYGEKLKENEERLRARVICNPKKLLKRR